MEKNERFKQAEIAVWVGIIGNIVLAVGKYIAGIISGSRALIADGVHSASDVAGSIAVWVGLRAAKQPPDEDHPYGHGKAESIAAIIVAVLLAIVGFEIGKTSFDAFFDPIGPPSMLAIYVIVISILVKEAMFQYKFRLGKKLKSDALIVNAYDDRSDVYASIATLVGIGASIIGGYLDIEWLVYADPVAGMIVAVLILKMAWTLGTESIHNTLDHVLHEEDTLDMRKSVESITEVKKINELHAREHGHYVIVDIKIAVDPHMTVEDGHLVGKKVKETLMEQEGVQDVFVHVNPYNPEN
ncbi:cation diffusion facilitator family transporter [Bacillus oleivorans]|uniref:Cation diffusion facilitator family transporter n=1 Tax=Bacillus oleivorans TaxID=1448271 RepID=A0A285CVU1_9BACI|nr:cation diffusion facilitator family transporter [Bacillus oleivorans]SNX71654.1 cation diffusion facilitator family transporter [Bacillus oleivorans]